MAFRFSIGRAVADLERVEKVRGLRPEVRIPSEGPIKDGTADVVQRWNQQVRGAPGESRMSQTSSQICSLQALLREVSQPLPQSVLDRLVQETFPEVRQIASESSREEAESALQQLKQRLRVQGSQGIAV
jgi:hypothetical protein